MGAEGRENISEEDSLDLLLCALTARLQTLLAKLEPLLEHLLEGVILSEKGVSAVLVSLLAGVDAAGNQFTSDVATSAGFFEGDSRVGTQRQPFLLAVPGIPKVPTFVAFG